MSAELLPATNFEVARESANDFRPLQAFPLVLSVVLLSVVAAVLHPLDAPIALAYTTLLTALMWVPYIITQMVTNGTSKLLFLDGAKAVLCYSVLCEQPLWAVRAKQAHANAVENLAVFAPAVLLVLEKGTQPSPLGIDANVWTEIYFYARILHYGAMISNIPVCRTLCFIVGWFSTIVMLIAVLT